MFQRLSCSKVAHLEPDDYGVTKPSTVAMVHSPMLIGLPHVGIAGPAECLFGPEGLTLRVVAWGTLGRSWAGG
jgi:hypothetical protein